MDRREFAIGLISTVVVGVSGCTFGRQDRRSLSIENRGSRDHVVVIELRSSYGDQPGQTEYFSQEFTISSDEATAYDDAVAVSDGPPRHMWIRVSIDDRRVTDEVYDFPSENIQITINGSRDASVAIDSS